MWSNLYAYYNIRSDKSYLEFHSTKEIIRVLKNTDVLRETDPMIFGNTSSFPWVTIGIAQTANSNFSIDDDANYEAANLLSVVTSKEHDQSLYKGLLVKIAEELGWEVVLEEDDDGNEDVVIYNPKGNL